MRVGVRAGGFEAPEALADHSQAFCRGWSSRLSAALMLLPWDPQHLLCWGGWKQWGALYWQQKHSPGREQGCDSPLLPTATAEHMGLVTQVVLRPLGIPYTWAGVTCRPGKPFSPDTAG